ncbi:ABC transporter ATP-binding protein [Brumimicrobium glaciale]|uniref:ABC transporter ATP-binding protein n=1 Tax=Brumimicrobium glaciale TaxID=200475 RepID=A0A4Q4KPI9_9FLAO|nr:ABC transporter ATP-binding protein [Brumimicrobium glaciale]RYM33919.1 ABC transporter ATP-binding protein [Brumimicrobium glaciale]
MNSIKNLLKKHFTNFIYFYKYLKYRLFIVIGFGVLVGVLDAFGLTMFLPILELTSNNNEITGESLGGMSIVIDGLSAIGIQLNLIVAVSILFIFFIFKGVSVYFSEVYKVNVNQSFISKIRIRLISLLGLYPFKNFVSADVGHIQNTFTLEASRVSSAYQNYINGIQQLLMALVYIIFVFMIDWKFAILVCVGGLLTNLVFGAIYKKTKQESDDLSQKNSYYQNYIIQYINNYKYLKATGTINIYSEKLIHRVKSIESTNKIMGKLNAQLLGSREPLLILVVCSVILIQVNLFDGELATILISLILFYRALTQLFNFQTSYNTFLGNSGSLKNISSFEKELYDVAEKDGTIPFPRFRSDISLKSIHFSFGEKQVINNINLNIPKNKTIAFAGESGSGKTTIVNLICGLLDTNEGNILIDNNDITSLKRSDYQQRIGYIAQEPIIFNDTIFNNISFWADPTPENIIRFEKAVEQASIKNYIEELFEREQTVLGNNGVNLSGGQKQRISIARELYKDIDILILDEATSALDSETETEIQKNIDLLKGEYTIIIIAHRLSTIKNADKIYLMEKGEIAAEGSFSELIKSSKRFEKMVELQEI